MFYNLENLTSSQKISAERLKTHDDEHLRLKKISLTLKKIESKLKDLNVKHNKKELQETLDMPNSKS
jgi:hypothetical protein